MDLTLLVLAASTSPLLPSAIAELTARPATSVRASLQRLSSVGLVAARKVSKLGPVGTFEWSATEEGRAAAHRVISFVRRGGK